MFKYNSKILTVCLLISLFTIGIAYFQTRATIDNLLFELELSSYTLSVDEEPKADNFDTASSFVGSTVTLKGQNDNIIRTKRLGTMIYPSILLAFLVNAYMFIIILNKLNTEEQASTKNK
ncbi:MAG: hypothetical protein ACOYVK_00075 [Bacillota bacterium]